MANINLTHIEVRVVMNALSTEYHHAKDEGNTSMQRLITKIEGKIDEQVRKEGD